MARIVKSKVKTDKYTDLVKGWFDVPFEGESTFECWDRPDVGEFSLGLIVGPSGSGKSLLLKDFGKEEEVQWDVNKAVVSHFSDAKAAVDTLMAVGMNNVRAFLRPYSVLSTGEKFRVDLARRLKDGAVIDEFTSVVDRNVAKAASVAIRKYVDKNGLKNVVLATCHSDVLEWLRPDWYFDTVDGTLHDGRLLRRPTIKVELYPCERSVWPLFASHHYLSHVLASAARCFVAVAELDGERSVVGFVSSQPLPSGTMKKAWREHRTVVLPDFQGLGIGPRISDAIAKLHLREGKRYFSRTAHPRFGVYRDKKGSGWNRTAESGKSREVTTGARKAGVLQGRIRNGFGDNRLAFCHEYVGRR
jgi:ABC-type ATPase involved in cell division/GNAT superfamily N-acetyltransferase